jgi:tryptophan 2,3-dioxygenase
VTVDVATSKVERWLGDADPLAFPYEPVLQEFLRVGKHFVADGLLKLLVQARAELAFGPGLYDSADFLRRFLDLALDKWDEDYDYRSYIGLSLLRLPDVEDPLEDLPFVLHRRDRLHLHLLADVLHFELAAADGRADVLPEMRPDARTVAKRCRLAGAAAAPALRRRFPSTRRANDPGEFARDLCEVVRADMSDLERRTLRLSVLPVYVAHDEYLFIRVLQLFENTFALLAVRLRGAVAALALRDAGSAIRCVRQAQEVLQESAPLFSLLATMQVESFRTFRTYTEGASAIQSRNYKIFESLCRRPDPERLNSAAYDSVPDVQLRAREDTTTLDDAYAAATGAGWLNGPHRDELRAAMEAFAATVLRWRTTHYRLAVRMLGDRTGTGYTAGTPYLKTVQRIPVFRSIDPPTPEGVSA